MRGRISASGIGGGEIEDVLKISKVKCCAVVCSTTAQDMHQQGNTDIT
jgi:hypothetical protein